ncbi:MAG: hypothetical protein LBP88_03740 [Treponema sp.]|jgi:phage baseplate assembly protein gpV|nr:hypothetical protein [Treponema sp.]
MQVQEMIVTDSAGKTQDSAGNSIEGTYGYCVENSVRNHYRFYAMEKPNPGPQTSGAKDTDPNKIQMVLPVGGLDSGLYRYPKIGERVLVSCPDSGSSYYMLGYIPSDGNEVYNAATDNYGEKNDLKDKFFDQEGMIFRYKNTADAFKSTASAHSEIGFYKKEKADWPVDPKVKNKTYPSIDTINIESAGDIKESAANHHLQSARRMEILVDVERLDPLTGKDAKGKTMAFGDNNGDDSNLYGGDLHVRAKNRIVIKAGSQILLQVGRTTLTIDDNGFNITTRQVTGNFPNSHDTSLNMTPRDGVTMSGKTVSIFGLYRLLMGDGLGGTIMSTLGNLNISGREIGIDSKDSFEYLFFTIIQGLKFALNATSGGMALNPEKNSIDVIQYIKKTEEFMETMIKKGRKWSVTLGKYAHPPTGEDAPCR